MKITDNLNIATLREVVDFQSSNSERRVLSEFEKDNSLNKPFGFQKSKVILHEVYANTIKGNMYWYNYQTNEAEAKTGPYFWVIEVLDSNDPVDKINTELAKVIASADNLTILPLAQSYRSHGSVHLIACRIAVTVKYNDKEIVMAMPFSFAESVFGLKINEDFTASINTGSTCKLTQFERDLKNLSTYRNRNYREPVKGFDFTFETLNSFNDAAKMSLDSLKTILKGLIKNKWPIVEIKSDGMKNSLKTLLPYTVDLGINDPIALCAFRMFLANSNRSIDSVKVSAVFNELTKDVDSQEKLIKVLKPFCTPLDDNHYRKGQFLFDDNFRKLKDFKEKRKVVIKSQAGRAMTKIMEDAESLTIDRKAHKLTWAKIESGELPLGAFFRKQEQYYILNDNWDLWEEMFKRGYGEQAIALANEVKGRTTYEKDLMSYFCFILHTLPKYLKKHTGHKWTCIPKLVDSESELEPPKEEDNGVSKSRSALTPIVDNEAKTVVVPYASLAIYGGRGTTYCYSHDYNVLHEGMSFNGCAIVNELETKLNGRDDYGLMFYTLTGSHQGRGYPTFLIIFERRESHKDTRVHFHRTHPSRSKDGEYNPLHNWIRGCYNWMAGNVNKARIKAQQGDLAFVQIKTDVNDAMDGSIVKDLDFSHKVDKCDNHCFATPVEFSEYKKAAKSNILGYVKLVKDTWLNHNEHDNVLIPQGTYAIHQCRSWEANPKGVWSLRID